MSASGVARHALLVDGFRRRVGDHGVSESFELADQATGAGDFVTALEPVRSEVPVRLRVGGRDQDRVPDGDIGPAHPTTPDEAGVLDGEVVLASHPPGRAGCLGQHSGQPLAPVPFTVHRCACAAQRTRASPAQDPAHSGSSS